MFSKTRKRASIASRVKRSIARNSSSVIVEGKFRELNGDKPRCLEEVWVFAFEVPALVGVGVNRVDAGVVR